MGRDLEVWSRNMAHYSHLGIPDKEIKEFCRRYHIRRLSFFGSVLRRDFGPDSDVDVLVEFDKGKTPGLIRLAGMELELSRMFGGRKVDMNTEACISRHFREQVLREAETLYVGER